MPPKGKGKAVIGGKDSSGKRKLDTVDEDKTGRKRKNPNVLQFFEDAADEVNDSDDSDFYDDDFIDKLFDDVPQVNNEPAKGIPLPFVPKEEEMTEEELDKMFEERYRSGSRFVTFAEDEDIENKRSFESNIYEPSSLNDPIVWKVKCMVGREKHSAFCLMQKFVDLRSLGIKLQIISAFAVDHVKGFIYIEASKQNDVNEACKGLCSIYSSRISVVSKTEISHLLFARSKCSEVSKGMWARVKNGTYKGDLAQVVDVNNARRRATIKLIPRLDLQALLAKYGGGSALKKTAIPAPRLIHSSELEEFRPLIQFRRDRETGEVYEFLDNLMLKDGYLFKKMSLDSLTNMGLTPSEDEILKFQPSESHESKDLEWLSQLYGEQKRKRITKPLKVGEKGEGSSSSNTTNGFEMHDLVCFGKKDFGVIVGIEKDDYKILRDGPNGPVVVTVDPHELKTALTDTKFTALDQHKKTLAIDDTVRVLEGPSKDRQGIVKQIYRGTIFLHDENIEENGGYFCAKSHMCEKVKVFEDAFSDKTGQSEAFGFGDFSSSPKSPLSSKKPWQSSENNRNFGRSDKDGMFSIGQALRIRVGPLKGYLCRVLAIRYSDITVKLDSQQRVLTVKCEHLSEVRPKSSAFSASDDPVSSSVKPFDLLGTQGSSGGWTDGAGTTGDGNGWNVGGAFSSGNARPAFPASGTAMDGDNTNPFGSVDNSQEKNTGAELACGAWDAKITINQNSSADSGWGQKKSSDIENNEGGSTWGKALEITTNKGNHGDAGSTWGQKEAGKEESAWGKKKADVGGSTWGKKEADGKGSTWGEKEGEGGGPTWGKKEADGGGSTWGKKEADEGGSTWGKKEAYGGGSTWGKKEADEGGLTWGKKEADGGGSTWGKKEADGGGSIWGKKEADGGSTWGKKESDGGGSTWGKKEIGGSTWGKNEADEGGSTWGGKGDGGSAQGTQEADRGTSWSQKNTDGGSMWGKKEAGGGSTWSNKQDGGSPWGKKEADGRGLLGKTEAVSGSSWNSKPDGESSWSKPSGGSWNSADGDRHEGWERQKTFEGGQGSGGRNGGGSRGGRDNFGGGRSYGRGRGTDWSRESQDTILDGLNSKWNVGQSAGWDKSGGFGGTTSDWRNPQTDCQENTGNSWSAGQNRGSGAEEESGGNECGWNKKSGGWNGRNVIESKADDAGKPGDLGDSASRWGQKGGNLDSGWGKSNWQFSGSENPSDSENCGWGQKGGNQDSGWAKSSWQSSGSEKPSDSKNSRWGKKEGNQVSSWSKSNWQSGGTEKPSDSENGGRDGNWGDRDGSDRGGFRGRGRGRGRSDRGGFGGRGNNFEGRGNNFEGRGGFGGGRRGGYGCRGQERSDDTDDWRSGNAGGSNGTGGISGGWSSSGGWKQGSSFTGKAGASAAPSWSGEWSSGSGSHPPAGPNSTLSQSGGWKSQGSGWGQAAGVKATSESDSGCAAPSSNQPDGGNSQGTGWNTKGSGGNAQSGGWNSAGAGSSGNQSDGRNSRGTGWNTKGSGGNAQSGGWNSAGAGSGDNQSNGGNSQGTGWNTKGSGGNAQSGGWNSAGAGSGDNQSNGGNSQGTGWNTKGSGGNAQSGGWISSGGWKQGSSFTSKAGASAAPSWSGEWSSGSGSHPPAGPNSISSQSGGWKSQGSGWGQAAGVKATSESDSGYAAPSPNQPDGGNSQGTGWNTKGSGGNAQSSGWNSAGAGSSGNQSDGGNSRGTGWNTKGSGGNAQSGGLNSAGAGSGDNQSNDGNSQGTGWNMKGSGGNAQSGGWAWN